MMLKFSDNARVWSATAVVVVIGSVGGPVLAQAPAPAATQSPATQSPATQSPAAPEVPAAQTPAAPAQAAPAPQVAPAPAPPAPGEAAPAQPPPAAYPPPYPPAYDPRLAEEREPVYVMDFMEGQPVPPGYTVMERRRKGLLIAGSIVFGVSYGISLSVAAGSEYAGAGGWLALPVVGPIIASTQLDDCEGDDFSCEDQGSERGFLMLDTLAQGAGATMFIIGLWVPRKVLVANLAMDLTLLPRVSHNTQGFEVLGRF